MASRFRFVVLRKNVFTVEQLGPTRNGIFKSTVLSVCLGLDAKPLYCTQRPFGTPQLLFTPRIKFLFSSFFDPNTIYLLRVLPFCFFPLSSFVANSSMSVYESFCLLKYDLFFDMLCLVCDREQGMPWCRRKLSPLN